MTAADLRALTRLPRQDVLSAFGIGEQEVVSGVAYQRLRPLDRADGPDGLHVFFDGDEVAVVYAGSPAGLSEADLRAEAGEAEPLLLASRAGPGAELVAHPEAGLAWSQERGVVQFVEAFPPMSAERYRGELDVEPRFLR